jgi:hypothetical protein
MVVVMVPAAKVVVCWASETVVAWECQRVHIWCVAKKGNLFFFEEGYMPHGPQTRASIDRSKELGAEQAGGTYLEQW